MITTAKDIIKRSLRLISATAAGEEPTAHEYTDCFNALTTLVEAWDIEKLMSSVDTVAEASALSGATQFTIGPAGDLVMDQIPTFLDYVYVSNGSINYEATIPGSRKEFDDEVQIDPVGWPQMAYFTRHDPASTESTLEFSCPLPDNATVKVGISSRGPAFADLITQVDLPPGLKRAIEYNLAIEVAPEFQAQPSPMVVQAANESKAMFKLHNFTVDKLQTPSEYSADNNRNGVFDYINGE